MQISSRFTVALHNLLDGKLAAIQTAMKNEMRKYTIADLSSELHELLKEQE